MFNVRFWTKSRPRVCLLWEVRAKTFTDTNGCAARKDKRPREKKSNLHSIIEKNVFSKYAGIWANVENIHESERIVVEL